MITTNTILSQGARSSYPENKAVEPQPTRDNIAIDPHCEFTLTPERLSHTIKEASELTGLSVSTIRRLIRRGKLRANTMTHRTIIAHAELVRFIEGGQ